ncbi:cytochrome P450 [Streptomyces somaliensis DSM 40738]|uniref:Cytochrome P450 n=1 Tax=Streptomyces somaliensis (strain ATCC 33201 / DSM 40738 / JCM 12659 / KCTC 9044 / NCTC 11332 / NRRL B-12077 / IP 733) TaxID=1134445 RepID=A0AA44IC84_STRE0|nr:cytochrome P450 [Streptomyces somaliensis]MCQ0025162.1 cytochrome P450 [Streptomyces somaliensis DSM 40738]NKY13404.1 cytochrome P450 [Streptomyces somaliensis DSM 40738]
MRTDVAADFGAFGEEFFRNPHPVYAELRARGPVHRVRVPEGAEAWLVVGHEACKDALTDPGLSKNWGHASPELPLARLSAGHNLLSSDPPDHTRLRGLVSREFTPRRVETLVPRVRALTGELLDTVLSSPDGRADLVEAFAFPLAIGVICELLGVPSLDRGSFRTWAEQALSSPDRDTRLAATGAMTAYLVGMIDEKRGRPGDDLLSALIRTTDEDGDRLSADELIGMAWLLLVAGFETTVNLIASGVLALFRHPDQLAALRADFGLIDNAVEEVLRYETPVETTTYRFTTGSVTIGGVTVPGGGELVLIALADAGRDAARFPDPNRFDIRRATGGHLSFGHGVHYCLGAPLARLQAATAITALLERCPDLALDSDPASLPWRQGLLIRGPRRLYVRWTDGTPEETRADVDPATPADAQAPEDAGPRAGRPDRRR